MVNKTLILILMICSNFIFAQNNQVKISNLPPQSEDFNFPLISFKQKPLVEEKINTFLQVSELEFVPKSGKNPYQLAKTATNSYQNFLYFYEWKKLEGTKNILSIEMQGEASGAYSEGFTNYRNFDLRTGNYINLIDLFQPNSVKTVESLINKKIEQRVEDYLKELKAEKTKDADLQDQISMYENCFLDYSLDYLEFNFSKNNLTFIAGRCSNHALRALDDLDDHEITFSYSDLQKYFSPYAKNLLSDSEKLTKTSFQNKLYHGKIDDKYPITVLITRNYADENSFTAVYWYDKTKKLIQWSGKINGNHLSITENDFYDEKESDWILRANIEADLNDRKIIGTWQDFKTKKFLKLELEEL